MSSATPRLAGLYAIADSRYLSAGDFVPAVRAALAGGARVIQYRDKKSAPPQREAIARDLQGLCLAHNVPLLINDDVRLARIVGAAGVHLGRDDMGLDVARASLGHAAMIGVSCYNELARAQAAQAAGANYVAFGSFFPSHTKPQATPATVGLLRTAYAELKIPIIAIGGITPENGLALIEAGAAALAVIEGVFNQTDIRAATERYARLFTKQDDIA